MYSASDFLFIRKAGFRKTYSCIENAMQYYNSDPETCCAKFRLALESCINDICHILDIDISDASINSKIDCIADSIPYELQDNKLIKEMHNLRTIGNLYAHIDNDSKEKNPDKDRLTCYCAMKAIGRWLITFSNEYPKYWRRKDEERKRRNETFNKVFKIIGSIVVVGATVVGSIIGIKKNSANK